MADSDMKSNYQTHTIFCGDCGYLKSTRHLFVCEQFNEALRSMKEGTIKLPIKGKTCLDFGTYNPLDNALPILWNCRSKDVNNL